MLDVEKVFQKACKKTLWFLPKKLRDTIKQGIVFLLASF